MTMGKKSSSGKSSQVVEPATLENREAALKIALQQIEKQFGKGAVQRLGKDAIDHSIECIPTGSIALDLCLGIGGIPKGRITEVYGVESSGKTTLTLHMIAQAQKQNGIAAFVDAEHALDPRYAEQIGVHLEDLIVSQPDNGEQALEICEALARSGAVDLIVVDSVAALVPKNEIDGEMGDAQPGQQARLMSQALRKLAGVLNKSNTAIVFINQLREKIGPYGGMTTTGGRALKFYSSVRIEVQKKDPLKNSDGVTYGNAVVMKVVKNKVAPPFKETRLDILFGEGISDSGSVLDMASDLDFISKSGSWYSYDGTRIGQGRETARHWLLDNPEIMDSLKKKILDHYQQEESGKSPAQVTGSSDDGDSDVADSVEDTNTQSEQDEVDELLNLEI